MIRVKRFVAASALAATATMAMAGAAGAAVNGASVTPQGGTFTPGQGITVSGAAGTVGGNLQVVISLCRNANVGASFSPQTDCDFTSAVNTLDPSNSDGSFSDSFTLIKPASWGTPASVCTVALPCRLRINTGTFNDVADQAFVPGFVIQTPAATTTTTGAPTTTTTAPTTTTTAPSPVVPEAPINILIPLGGAAALGGAYFLVRRGRTA